MGVRVGGLCLCVARKFSRRANSPLQIQAPHTLRLMSPRLIALLAMAIGEQILISINAVVVAVTPEKHYGISPYRLGVFQARLFGRKLLDKIKPPRQTHLPPTARARTMPA